MKNKLRFCLFFLLAFSVAAFCQTKKDSFPPPESRMLRFVEAGRTDTTNRAVLNIFVREQDTGESVLGATVLLQRAEPEQVYGKITQWDGRCRFKAAPGVYKLRVQLTGMVTFEKENIELLPGRQYDMALEMARMKTPVPSAKQQAGKN